MDDTNEGSRCRICGSKWMRKYGSAICEGGHNRGIPMVNDGDRYCICGAPFLRDGVCSSGHSRGPIEPHKAGAGCLGCVGVIVGIGLLLFMLKDYTLSSFQVPPELLIGFLVIMIIIGAIKVLSSHHGIEESDYPSVWRE